MEQTPSNQPSKINFTKITDDRFVCILLDFPANLAGNKYNRSYNNIIKTGGELKL